MKKKFLCGLLTASLIAGSLSPVFAAETKETAEPMSLSLSQAIDQMKTQGARAEEAKLHKKSDQAVASGYSETVIKIRETMDKLDYADSVVSQLQQAGWTQEQIAATMKSKYGASSVAELAYNAQMQGVTQNNKKIMQLRRNFAQENIGNNFAADMNQIEQETLRIYSTVLLAEDNCRIAKDGLAAQERTLKTIRAKKDAGVLTKKDVLQAESAVAEAKSQLQAAETQVKYAHMSFNYLLGYPARQMVVFTDKLTLSTGAAIGAEAAKQSGTDQAALDLAVTEALANRNEIRGADFAKEIYDLLLKDVNAYPKSSATYRNAELNVLTAEKTAADARVQIEIDIRNRAATVADKRAALEAAYSLQAYAKEGVRLLTLTAEEGMSTTEELLNMQVTLYKANLNVAKAISEYNLALKGFEDAKGIGTMRIPL